LSIPKKNPRLEKIAPVFAVIVMMIYTWSLLHFFWRLPSWLNFSTLGQIAVLFSYTVVVNLIESALILVTLIALCVILPPKWFYDQFVTKGVSMTLLGLGGLMALNKYLLDDILSPRKMLANFFTFIAAIFILTFLIDRIGILKKGLEELANRMVVFLYIWMPISALSLLTVLIRNIF
jgi:hypothetical protein